MASGKSFWNGTEKIPPFVYEPTIREVFAVIFEVRVYAVLVLVLMVALE